MSSNSSGDPLVTNNLDPIGLATLSLDSTIALAPWAQFQTFHQSFNLVFILCHSPIIIFYLNSKYRGEMRFQNCNCMLQPRVLLIVSGSPLIALSKANFLARTMLVLLLHKQNL